ncbi:ribbon-helix-helix protein, CopG family [Streptomyces sp. NPDC000927]|uniref:ribbon-helix-helix protein, CopG family n=1 Tax=Streptomyces sp. NPDC000927 TaxID=3154371 RepID=UPI003318ABC3
MTVSLSRAFLFFRKHLGSSVENDGRLIILLFAGWKSDMLGHGKENAMTEKRKRGRPRVGPKIEMLFPVELIQEIDKACKGRGLSRSAWMREAAQAAIDRRPEPAN